MSHKQSVPSSFDLAVMRTQVDQYKKESIKAVLAKAEYRKVDNVKVAKVVFKKPATVDLKEMREKVDAYKRHCERIRLNNVQSCKRCQI